MKEIMFIAKLIIGAARSVVYLITIVCLIIAAAILGDEQPKISR